MPRKPGVGSSAGRSGYKWKRVVSYFKENEPWVCHLCREDIEFDLDHQKDPRGYTLDHVKPLVQILAEGLDPYDKGNLAPAHRVCNSKKGTSDGIPSDESGMVRVSRQW